MYYTNVLDLIGNTPLISLEETTGLFLPRRRERDRGIQDL